MPAKKAKPKNLNTECPWSEKSCFKDFLCLLCVYAFLVEKGDLDLADDTYMRWEPLFKSHKVERAGGATEKSLMTRMADGNNPLPTSGQLAIIEMLSKKLGVPPPKVSTSEEAKEIINQLKRM